MKINKVRFFTILLLSATILFVFCSKKPTEPEAEDAVISGQAVQLKESTLNAIVSVDTSGTITFSEQSSDVSNLQQGSLIASKPITAAPYGFLKKVESISTSGSQVVVTTSNATLEEIFERMTVEYEKTLTMDDLDGSPSLKKGITLKRSKDNGFYFDIDDIVLYDLDGNLSSTEDQIKAEGSISITPSFTFNLDIDNFTLKELRFVNTTVETAELKISCGVSLSYQPEIELANLPFNPIVIWVGWVPIVIRPVLSIDVGAEVSASVGFSTGVTQTATLEAGLEYKNSQWNPVSNFTKSFEYNPPELTASVSVKGYTGPQLNLMLYGIAGPYADINGYLQLSADIFQTPWWELHGGMEIGVGVEVEFLGQQVIDYYVPAVVSYDQLIAQAQGVLEGTISGTVKDAVNLSSLSNVTVSVKKDGSLIAQTSSDYQGEYSVNVQVGSGYIVEFAKTGYLPVTYENVQVAGNSDTYLEPILQIDQSYSGDGNIQGTINDALSGSPVAGISLYLRLGLNNRTGNVVASTTTDYYGDYSFSNIQAGNYTVEASASGYSTTYFSVICIGGQTTYNQNGTITPIINSDEIRIILTWGEYPNDLDSHLTGPTPDGYRFHTYYSYKTYYYENELYVQLDLDDVTSWGPETTTIYYPIDGLYRYSVHDYSNRYSTYSKDLSNSSAQVRVYKGGVLLQTFHVPTNTEGTLWTVFEMFDDTIVPKNIMSYESSPSSITKASSDETDAHLLRNLPEK